jgi:hypothetical protein
VASRRFPRLNLAQELQTFVVQMFGNDGSDWLANHFLGRITVEVLRTLIPRHDDPCKIAAEYRIVGARPNDGCETVLIGFGAGFAGADDGIPLRTPNWRNSSDCPLCGLR